MRTVQAHQKIPDGNFAFTERHFRFEGRRFAPGSPIREPCNYLCYKFRNRANIQTKEVAACVKAPKRQPLSAVLSYRML
jgi:hypothetical protein